MSARPGRKTTYADGAAHASPRATPHHSLRRDSALLFLLALVGAGIVHLLAYHVPVHVPFGLRWAATALYLLVHCPLIAPIGGVLALGGLAWLSTAREVGRLRQVSAHLAGLISARSAPPTTLDPVQPRSPRRLAVVVLALLVAQAAVFTVADALFPMHMTMVMDGTTMVMPAAAAAPLWMLHALVALGLGGLFWRCERRLAGLRAQVAAYLRVLFRSYAVRVLPVLARRFPPPLTQWYGVYLFARPPPAF